MIDQGASPYSPPKANLEGGSGTEGAPALASPGSRLAAYVIDSLVFKPAFILAGVISAVTQAPPGATPAQPGPGQIAAGAIMIVASLAIGVYQIVLLSTRGQTIGKRLMKIRIVRTDGLQPGFMGAVVLRGLVGGLPWVIPFYGLVDCLFIFRPDRRCIHDHIASTRVVMADATPVGVAIPAV